MQLTSGYHLPSESARHLPLFSKRMDCSPMQVPAPDSTSSLLVPLSHLTQARRSAYSMVSRTDVSLAGRYTSTVQSLLERLNSDL
jgi:hypothetical protein